MKSSPKNEIEEEEDTDAKSSKKNVSSTNVYMTKNNKMNVGYGYYCLKDQDDEKEEKEDDDKAVDKEKASKEQKVDAHSKKSVDSSTSRRNRSTKRESVSPPPRKSRAFIKLFCVHCRVKCRAFSVSIFFYFNILCDSNKEKCIYFQN